MHAGGYDYDGADIAAVDEAEVRGAARAEWAAGVRSFVVAGVFSPARPEQEDDVARMLNAELAALAAADGGKCSLHARPALGSSPDLSGPLMHLSRLATAVLVSPQGRTEHWSEALLKRKSVHACG